MNEEKIVVEVTPLPCRDGSIPENPDADPLVNLVDELASEQPVELIQTAEEFKLGLVIWPDPTLKAPVMNFPEEHLGSPLVRNTADKMLELMYHYKGVGLASQQVSVPFRMFVMDQQKDDVKTPQIFLNPKVTEVGDKFIQVNHPGEGCLSFPYGFHSPVPRLEKLELEWLDFNGIVHHQWFEGAEAIIVQHEMDHLDGYCFIDRLSWMKRNLAIRKARRIRARYKKGMRRAVSAMKNAPRTPEHNLKRLQMFENAQRAKERINGLSDQS